jgi:DNA repair protein RadC
MVANTFLASWYNGSTHVLVELPREKLEKYGPKKLLDYELLAILLGSGVEGLNVLELSKKILKTIQSEGRAHITLDRLKQIHGLGTAKACQIIALLELGARLNDETLSEILSATDIWKLCSDIRESKKEHFVAFYLDTQSRLIERQIISIGTLNASIVHPREVFEPAITFHAASIIVAHNHPSESLEPSDADRLLTRNIKQSGEMLGIPLESHIIVTKRSFVDFLGQI